MIATIARTTPTGRFAPAPPARLSLAPKNSAPGLLDGAWWPRSRDLAGELHALTAALDGPWGRVTRVTVNPAHWPVVPHKVPVAGRAVHVGWFADEQDPHKLILLSYTVGRLDLLVVPPETDPAVAVRLMAAAAAPGGLLTAGRMMAGEGPTRAAAETGDREGNRGPEEDWDTDGGAGPATRSPAGPLGSVPVRSASPVRRR